MPDITISVTDTELKCLEYVAVSPSEWVDNSATNRARLAQEEIIAKLVTHCNENEIAIAVGKDAQVTQAYDLGVVQSAADANAAAESIATPE